MHPILIYGLIWLVGTLPATAAVKFIKGPLPPKIYRNLGMGVGYYEQDRGSWKLSVLLWPLTIPLMILIRSGKWIGPAIGRVYQAVHDKTPTCREFLDRREHREYLKICELERLAEQDPLAEEIERGSELTGSRS